MSGTEISMWSAVCGAAFLLWMMSGAPGFAVTALASGIAVAWGRRTR